MLPEHTGPRQRLKTGLGAPVAPNNIADAHRNKAKWRKATSSRDSTSPAHTLTCRLEVCTNTEITRAGAMLMHACYCRQGSYLRVPPCVTAPLHSTAGTTAACCHPSYLLLCLDKQSWDEPASDWKKWNINIPRRMQELQQRARRLKKRWMDSWASPDETASQTPHPSGWVAQSAITQLLCHLWHSLQASTTSFCQPYIAFLCHVPQSRWVSSRNWSHLTNGERVRMEVSRCRSSLS